MKELRFLGQVCSVSFARYVETKNISMQLWCDTEEDGMSYPEPMGRATVNIPGVDLPDTHVCIKDYSENTGMLKALVDAGYIEDTGKMCGVGNLCKLLVDPEC